MLSFSTLINSYFDPGSTSILFISSTDTPVILEIIYLSIPYSFNCLAISMDFSFLPSFIPSSLPSAIPSSLYCLFSEFSIIMLSFSTLIHSLISGSSFTLSISFIYLSTTLSFFDRFSKSSLFKSIIIIYLYLSISFSFLVYHRFTK